jgi:ABC-type sugar transport system substrate-binding protein
MRTKKWLPLVPALLVLLLSGCRLPDRRPLIFIIVPSQDNPFFKAEADAADA